MGHGQLPSIENTNSPPEKPEDKLARKANDSLQGDVSKQGFEGLNIQVNQENRQEKVDRKLTLDEQLQKNGIAKMGIITRDFNCSVEISGTDPKTGKAIEYVRGRSPEEVARAKQAESQNSQLDQEQAYKNKFGEDADRPVGLAKLQQEEKPVLLAYGNDTASDASVTLGQVYYDAQQQHDKVPGVGWTPLSETIPGKTDTVAQLHWDVTGEAAGYGHRPKDFPEPVRGSEPFIDSGKNIELGVPDSWTLPTRENYKGWVPGDPINPLTWATDSSLYVQEVMKQNFTTNSDGKRVVLFDQSIDKDFKYRFGNAVRHAIGIGDLVFNHDMDPKTAENWMLIHEPQSWISGAGKALVAGSREPFDKEMADSKADMQNNAYAAKESSKFHDFNSFERQMLNDGWNSASKNSWVFESKDGKQ